MLAKTSVDEEERGGKARQKGGFAVSTFGEDLEVSGEVYEEFGGCLFGFRDNWV